MTEITRLCGRHVHLAAQAIHTIRETALDKAGLTFAQFEILDKGPGRRRDELAHTLARLTVDTETGVAEAIDQLHDQCLVVTDDQGTLELTPQGRALAQQANAAKADLQAALFDAIAAPELATTKNVLTLITNRARHTADTDLAPGADPTRLGGRHIHMAAQAIRTIRETALKQAGLTFTQWQVLDKGPGRTRQELAHILAELTVDTETGVAQAIEALHDQGLVATDDQGTLELTPQGRALAQQVDATRTNLHTRLYTGIAAPDLATATRVLDLLTQRARLAASRSKLNQ